MVNAMDAVNAALVKKWPDRMVYVDYLPQNFRRPSFMLQQATIYSRPITRKTVEFTVYLTIVCIVPVNDYNQQDQVELLNLQREVLALFERGYVQAGDRMPKVASSSGGSDIGAAYVDLTITYAEDVAEDAETYPNMNDININYRRDA